MLCRNSNGCVYAFAKRQLTSIFGSNIIFAIKKWNSMTASTIQINHRRSMWSIFSLRYECKNIPMNSPRKRKTWWMTAEALPVAAVTTTTTTECRRINIKGHLCSDCILYIDPLNVLCINKFVSSGISDLTMAENRKLQIKNCELCEVNRTSERRVESVGIIYVIWSTKSTTTTQHKTSIDSDRKKVCRNRVEYLRTTQNNNEKKYQIT